MPKESAASVHAPTEASDVARRSADADTVARTGRMDAARSGIVRGTDDVADALKRGAIPSRQPARQLAADAAAATGEGDEADAGDAAGANAKAQMGILLQRDRNLRSKIADAAAEEADESDELEGSADARRAAHDAKDTGRRLCERKRNVATDGGQSSQAGSKTPTAATRKTTAGTSKKAKGVEAQRRIQSRRTWMKARAAQEKTGEAVATTVARKEGVKALAATAPAAAAPVAGVLCGIIAFVLAAMVVSQAISSLFGFWENEYNTQAVSGLPPYITCEMVETALEMQDAYGHPAGCTIAQIICESGQGDHLSGLATRDSNLFGIKWAPSFAFAGEVEGKDSWETGEEIGGVYVTVIAEFTKFKSHRDCIVFRSRVLLQADRYARNALIQEAIATHSSDKMAEGLADAGYATSSAYADSLKSVMGTYNLYRFDSMTAEQYRSAGASGSVVVEAAYSQLGVPYVWGGTTPNVGLDCSGLTQHCYSCAGKSIPRTADDQYAGGTAVPLSEARPGDILWRSGHVAIYIGGDSYIHEPQTGEVCAIAEGISYFTCAVRY